MDWVRVGVSEINRAIFRIGIARGGHGARLSWKQSKQRENVLIFREHLQSIYSEVYSHLPLVSWG